MDIISGRPAMSQSFQPVTIQDFEKATPETVKALRALGATVDASGLEKPLTELIKVRVSQLNGCAFCIQFHLNLARKLGVSQAKLDLVAAWREAGVYSARELAALELAETLTLEPEAGVEAVEEAGEVFTEDETRMLVVSIATINAWNRIAAPLGFQPPASV
jgi:AhpD family alkylhydroperoxidase